MSITIVAKNQTALPLSIDQLSVEDREIPASGQVTLTTDNTVAEIQADVQLLGYINDDSVLLNDGSSDLTKQESLDYITPVVSTKSTGALDTHVDSSSNPHTVTATQVGLGSVTNDAQLKRAAGDIDSFAAKATPVGADLVLIEDSEDSNSKKKATAESLTGAAIYGSQFNQASSEGQDDTTSTAWVEKLSLAVTGIPAGLYRIGWYAELKQSAVADAVEMRVQLNDTTTLAEVAQEPKDTRNWLPAGGFKYESLAAGDYDVDMDVRQQRGSTASIRRARIEFWRIS